ncbi:MAG TPA: hypothetical protein VGC41_05735 [Kofleriaceae bacterium]
MRNHPLPTITTHALDAVTGGCHKGPPPQAAAAPTDPEDRVQVQVATGLQGGQMIQQALQGGSTPTA